jgi:hypothetical protein
MGEEKVVALAVDGDVGEVAQACELLVHDRHERVLGVTSGG